MYDSVYCIIRRVMLDSQTRLYNLYEKNSSHCAVVSIRTSIFTFSIRDLVTYHPLLLIQDNKPRFYFYGLPE
jgi:hypothetical protein